MLEDLLYVEHQVLKGDWAAAQAMLRSMIEQQEAEERKFTAAIDAREAEQQAGELAGVPW